MALARRSRGPKDLFRQQRDLFINQEDDGAYLDVYLIDHYQDQALGCSNRNGIGAKVSVYEPGFLGQADHLLGYREVEAHGGFSCQNQAIRTSGFRASRRLMSVCNGLARSTQAGATIEFARSSAGPAEVAIFDAGGRLIRWLPGGSGAAGAVVRVNWDGRDRNGVPAPVGLYFVETDGICSASGGRVLRLR